MTGIELKEKRKALGYSQEELASKVGVGRKTILKLEKLEIIDPAKSTLLDNFFKTVNEDESKYTTGLEQFSIDQIAVYLINNHDAFVKSKTYQLYKKDVIISEAKNLIEEEYGDIIAELKKRKLS